MLGGFDPCILQLLYQHRALCSFSPHTVLAHSVLPLSCLDGLHFAPKHLWDLYPARIKGTIGVGSLNVGIQLGVLSHIALQGQKNPGENTFLVSHPLCKAASQETRLQLPQNTSCAVTSNLMLYKLPSIATDLRGNQTAELFLNLAEAKLKCPWVAADCMTTISGNNWF